MLPLYIELPDHGEGSCVFLSVSLDISPGTHSSGLSAMLPLGVVAIKGNTGKRRSKCEKIETEGLLDSPSKERPSSQTFSLFCWQETCKIRLIYRKLPLKPKVFWLGRLEDLVMYFKKHSHTHLTAVSAGI